MIDSMHLTMSLNPEKRTKATRHKGWDKAHYVSILEMTKLIDLL